MGEKDIPREDMIEDVQKVAEKLDEQYITISEYKEHGEYHFETLMSRFVNWQKVMDEAGLEQSKVTKEQLLEDFKKVANGRDIEVVDYTDEGKYSYHYIQKYYGGIGKMKEELGIKGKFDKEKIIEDLKESAEKVEGNMSIDDYKEVGNYKPQTIQSKYGWNDIKEEAGLEINKRGSTSSTIERLDEIVELFEEGLTRREISDRVDISYTHFVSEISKLGIKIRNIITRTGGSTFIITINEDDVKELGFNPDEKVYYEKSIKDGSIIIDLSENRVDRESLPEKE